MKDFMVSNVKSGSKLSFLICILFRALAFMYSIWDCHVPLPQTAVNLDICDQRQVIPEHRSCKVKGGGYASFV